MNKATIAAIVLGLAACGAFGAKHYAGSGAKSYSIGVVADPGAELTMSMWIAQSTAVYSNPWRRIFAVSSTGLEYSGFFGGNYADAVYFGDGASGYANANVSAGSVAANNSTWAHLVGTKSSASNRVVWLNGVAKATNSTSIASTSNRTNVYVGYQPSWDSTPYPLGALGELAAWNVVLTQGEIQALAAGVSALRVRPQSLILYLPMASPSTNSDANLIGKGITHTTGVAASAHPKIYR